MIEIQSTDKRFRIRHVITCACGCGEIIVDIDDHNRPRRFVKGHSSRDLLIKNKISERNKGRLSPMKGKHHSDESKKKNALAHIGRKASEATKLKMSMKSKGRKLPPCSTEAKLKMSLAKKGRHLSLELRKKYGEIQRKLWANPKRREKASNSMKKVWANREYKERLITIINNTIPRGEKANGWRGGLSFIPYTKDFNKIKKEYIRDRDGHVCQVCFKTEIENGKKLTIHHIDYDKVNCSENNLISLCVSCNTRVNYYRNFWMSFFGRLLKKYSMNNVILEGDKIEV